MKTFNCYLLISLLILVGCKKNENDNENDNELSDLETNFFTDISYYAPSTFGDESIQPALTLMSSDFQISSYRNKEGNISVLYLAIENENIEWAVIFDASKNIQFIFNYTAQKNNTVGELIWIDRTSPTTFTSRYYDYNWNTKHSDLLYEIEVNNDKIRTVPISLNTKNLNFDIFHPQTQTVNKLNIVNNKFKQASTSPNNDSSQDQLDKDIKDIIKATTDLVKEHVDKVCGISLLSRFNIFNCAIGQTINDELDGSFSDELNNNLREQAIKEESYKSYEYRIGEGKSKLQSFIDKADFSKVLEWRRQFRKFVIGQASDMWTLIRNKTTNLNKIITYKFQNLIKKESFANHKIVGKWRYSYMKITYADGQSGNFTGSGGYFIFNYSGTGVVSPDEKKNEVSFNYEFKGDNLHLNYSNQNPVVYKFTIEKNYLKIFEFEYDTASRIKKTTEHGYILVE